jgi:hypothetical protein
MDKLSDTITVQCKIAAAGNCKNDLKGCPHFHTHWHQDSCDIVVPDAGNCHGAVCLSASQRGVKV